MRANAKKLNQQIRANFSNGINGRRFWESQLKANLKATGLERVARAEGTGARA